MKQFILELLAIVGLMFTGFSIIIFFFPPIGREAREMEERSKTDPAMRDRDEYARYCFSLIWAFIGLAVAARIAVAIWSKLFGS